MGNTDGKHLELLRTIKRMVEQAIEDHESAAYWKIQAEHWRGKYWDERQDADVEEEN